MKKLIIILIICLFPSLVLANEVMDVKTGYGYIKDSQGRIVCRYDLPPGKHPIKDGYAFIEVADKKELDKIEVYKEPTPVLTPEEKLNRMGITKEELKELIK